MKKQGLADKEQRSKSLYYAVLSCNLLEVKEFTKEDNNASYRDCKGNTALHIAASRGHFEIVEELMRLQVNVNALNNLGRSPIFLATLAKYNNGSEISDYQMNKAAKFDDVILLLKNSEADLSIRDTDGVSLSDLKLIPAFYKRDAEEIARLIKEEGVNINAQVFDRSTLLQHTVKLISKDSDLGFLKDIIKLGSQVNFMDDYNDPLRLVLNTNSSTSSFPLSPYRCSIAQILAENGAKVNEEKLDLAEKLKAGFGMELEILSDSFYSIQQSKASAQNISNASISLSSNLILKTELDQEKDGTKSRSISHDLVGYVASFLNEGSLPAPNTVKDIIEHGKTTYQNITNTNRTQPCTFKLKEILEIGERTDYIQSLAKASQLPLKKRKTNNQVVRLNT